VRAVPIEFDGVTKAGGRLLSPGIKRRSTGQVIKSIVDFDRIKSFTVVGKPLRFRQFLGIENTAPVIVMITGSTNSGPAIPMHY
jgi:hypothetical protein